MRFRKVVKASLSTRIGFRFLSGLRQPFRPSVLASWRRLVGLARWPPEPGLWREARKLVDDFSGNAFLLSFRANGTQGSFDDVISEGKTVQDPTLRFLIEGAFLFVFPSRKLTFLVTESSAAFIYFRIYFADCGGILLNSFSLKFAENGVCGARSCILCSRRFSLRKMSENRKLSSAPRGSRPSGSLRNAELRNRLAIYLLSSSCGKRRVRNIP